jgi:hypothetical protein
MKKFSIFCCGLGVFALAACSDEVVQSTRPTVPQNLTPRTVVYPSDSYVRGIYYFAGWEDVPSSSPLSGIEWPHRDGSQWNLINGLSERRRTPLYGYVNENQQSIANDHIRQMAGAGFTYVAYQTGWSHDLWRSQGAAAALYMKYALKNHIASPYASHLKFALTWHNVQSSPAGGGVSFWTQANRPNPNPWTATQYAQNMEAMFRAWFVEYVNASPYFYKINGRPLFVFFAPQDMENVPAGFLGPQGVISLLNQVAAQYGYSGATKPYLLATAIAEDRMVAAATWGFDAVSGYVYYPAIHNYADIKATFDWHWTATLNTIAGTNLKYFVPTIAGLDKTPWNDPPVPNPNYGEPANGAEFASHIEAAKAKAAANQARTNRNIITCCWNEFGEGPYLQPTQEKGYMFLDAYVSTVEWPGIRY